MTKEDQWNVLIRNQRGTHPGQWEDAWWDMSWELLSCWGEDMWWADAVSVEAHREVLGDC